MQEILNDIITIFKTISIQDYILFFLVLILIFVYNKIGVNKLYKTFFGIFIGFSLFSLVNLVYFSINPNPTGLVEFMLQNKTNILYVAFYIIPLLGILATFNDKFDFIEDADNSLADFFKTIILTPFLVAFIISIYTSVIGNKLIFGIDSVFIESVKIGIIGNIMDFFNGKSIVFGIISQNDYLICFAASIFIFYVMFLGSIINNLFKFLQTKFKRKKPGDLPDFEDIS